MASKSIEFGDSAGDASAASHRQTSILLKEGAHFTDSKNETTATAKSMSGYTLAISFWMSKPPELSFFAVHCSKPPNTNSKTPNFKVTPHVVGAQGPSVLLRACFYSCLKDEYFLYRAGDGESPSLEWVPPPDGNNHDSLSRVREFGIVPFGFGLLHYYLAALCDAPSDYQLRIYSSETKTWSTKTLLNPCPGVKAIVPEKVIRIGESILGWVDLSRGLLVCDLREELPYVHFIPLPGNKGKLKQASQPGVSARWFRDLTYVNGVIKFIEMEHCFKETEKLVDPSDMNILFDSDLIMSLRHKDMDEEDKSRDGWRALTWTRAVWSNFWSKGCSLDVADILVDESTYPSLLSGIRGKSVKKLTFKDMYADFPNLSSEGDDIVYLKSMVEPRDQNGWVVAVNLRNKTMKTLGVYSFEHPDPSKHVFRLCTLSNHLNMSPGTEVSACVKVTQGWSSADDPDNKLVRVDVPISCESRGEPLPQRTLAETNGARNGAQSIVYNDHISWDHPAGDMHMESTRKVRRIALDESMRKVRRIAMDLVMKRERNEGQGVAQSGHVSWIRPVQNNLKCFNKLDGSCGPGYAPLDPGPILRSYGIDHPLWQPSPSKQ